MGTYDSLEADLKAILRSELVLYARNRKRGSEYLGSVEILLKGRKYPGYGPFWQEEAQTEQHCIETVTGECRLISSHLEIAVKLYSSLTSNDYRQRFAEMLLAELNSFSPFTDVAYMVILILWKTGNLRSALRKAKWMVAALFSSGVSKEIQKALCAALRAEHNLFTEDDLNAIGDFMSPLPNLVPYLQPQINQTRMLRLRDRLSDVNPELNSDRDRIKSGWDEVFSSSKVPDLIDNIEGCFTRGDMNSTEFAACIERVRMLLKGATEDIARESSQLVGQEFQGKWNNENDVRDFLGPSGLSILTSTEVDLYKALKRFASQEGAHRVESRREYARLCKNIAYEFVLLMWRKLEGLQSAKKS